MFYEFTLANLSPANSRYTGNPARAIIPVAFSSSSYLNGNSPCAIMVTLCW